MGLEDRAQFTVYAFHQCARDNHDPDLFFSQKALRWSVQNCSGGGSEWLELKVLRLLAEELEWQNSNADRGQACAAIWRLFCDMQTLASAPHPELAWWSRSEIHRLDQHLHQAIDCLIAEQYNDARKLCLDAQEEVDRLAQKSQLLTQAFELRDEVYWSTPHRLRWYLQRYRFDGGDNQKGSPNDLEAELGLLGEVVALTHKLSLLLKPSLNAEANLGLAESTVSCRQQ